MQHPFENLAKVRIRKEGHWLRISPKKNSCQNQIWRKGTKAYDTLSAQAASSLGKPVNKKPTTSADRSQKPSSWAHLIPV